MRRALEQTHGVRYVPSLDRFILSPSGSDKTQIFPFFVVSDIAIFVLKRDVKLQLTNFPFFGLRHFVVSPIAGNLIKLNMGAQLQTKASKSFTPS